MNTKSYRWPQNIPVPVAEKKPHVLVAHEDTRVDNYFWMNDFFKKGPDSEQAVDYLKRENDYLHRMMSGLQPLQESLFKELKARIKEKDESVPYFENGYWYFLKFETDSQYPVYCRKKQLMSAMEEVVHDSNLAAKDKSYYQAAGLKVSDNNQLLAIGEDELGRRLYSLRFKDLVTGDFFPETIANTEGDQYAWAADNKTIFYILKDLTTLLGFQVWRHELGTDPLNDLLVYEEPDNRHNISLKRCKSKKFILIESELSEQQSEHRFINAECPADPPRVFQDRRMGLIYDIDHFENKFYIRTNLDAPNFRLMETPDTATEWENWKAQWPNRSGVYLASITVFKHFLVISERENGLLQLRVIDQQDQREYFIPFAEPAYFAVAGNNPEFNSEILRYHYTSMITPYSVFDFNLRTKEQELKKQQDVLGGYQPEQYITERLFAKARDGVRVPLSLVYKKGMKKDGTNPLLLYAYGSYGSSMEADFDRDRLSLLDRGFVFAIAHIRGGQEMGRQWYEDGKMLKKKNTFYDFIDAAEFLVRQKYSSKDRLYASGGSAGGLLIGAVTNLRPDLWHALIADVPFVDVITTMSDSEIPLTTSEYLEWGNPAVEEEYFYIKSYSPYDNVACKSYPNMLILTSLHDSQVQYFEPAKWVAKMREMKSGENILLLHTNMEAGHGGASGRFDYLREVALQYSFLLAMEGITE